MPRIIIVGGGFAGVKCARVLNKVAEEFDVVLFNPVNHMVFTPLLADVAGSSLNPRSITAPLRLMLRKVHCRTELVTGVDLENRQVQFRKMDGQTGALGYDELVLAVGNRVDLSRVPGMMSNALPLKAVGDAIAMRQRVMERLEQADATEDREERRWLCSFVVIGGGFSGVEVAGEINDLARHALKYYRNVSEADIRVTLVHSRREILPEVTSRLRGFALKRMQRNGVEFVLEARAAAVTRRAVQLQDGREIPGGTIVCTVGNTACELIERLPVEKAGGRIVTAPDMQVPGLEGVWAIGDCALVPNAHDGEMAPPTAQFAERQGCQTAQNIQRKLGGQPTRPFRFRPVGVAAGIGSRKGVAQLFGVRISGFFAFWLWRSAFLVKLPSFLQKIKVGFDWAWELVFPRDISAFSTAATQPVSRNFFAAGEVVMDSAHAGQSLYALEQGECEIVQTANERHGERVLAVVGPGELIGPHTLETYSEEPALLRARCHTEAIGLADDFLQRMSGALKPVELMLKRAMLTHKSFWHDLPGARASLEQVSCGALMRPASVCRFDEQIPVIKAFHLVRKHNEAMGLVENDGQLVGLVTRTDLIAGLEQGPATPVGQVMSRHLALVSADEPALVAANTLRDRGFKWLPVVEDRQHRRISGLLYAEDLVACVLEEVKVR